jgi:hypothetical protein
VESEEERSLRKKGQQTRRIGRSILVAAASVKKREDQLRRTTRELRKPVAKCIEDDGGILEHSFEL